MRPALDLAKELQRSAQSADDRVLLMFAQFALAFSCFQVGQLLVAKEHFETAAIALYDRECHRPLALQMIGTDTEVQCLGHLAYTLWALGYADQALEWANESLNLARAISQPFSIVLRSRMRGSFVYIDGKQV